MEPGDQPFSLRARGKPSQLHFALAQKCFLILQLRAKVSIMSSLGLGLLLKSLGPQAVMTPDPVRQY